VAFAALVLAAQPPTNEEAEIKRAIALQQSGKPDEAIAQYQRTLKRYPQSAAAHNWLGVAYLQKNQLAAGEAQFRAAIKLDPQYVRAYNNLGSTLAQAGDIPQAIDILRKGLKLAPADTALRLNLAMALRAKGDAAEALPLLESLATEHPEEANFSYQLGQTLRQNGNLPAALDAFEKALDANGEMPEAYYALAATLKEQASAQRRLGEANLLHSTNRADLEQALALNPAAANAYSLLGRSYRESGDLPRARRMFQRALALNPNAPYPYFDLAVIYLRQQQLPAAIGQFESGLNLGFSDTPIPDLDLAINELRQAIARDPKNAEAHNTLGRLLGWAGASEKQIIAEFEEAIRLEPSFAQAHNNLGLVYTQSGEDDKAAVAYREAVKLRPDFADAHQNLGTLLITSDAAEAVRELEKAISLQPRLLKAHYNLALAYDANPADGPTKEIAELQKLLAIDPKFPRTEFALGKALLKTGKINDAIAHLQTAVANDPKSGEAYYQLGLALSRAGRKQEGAEAIAKSREYLAAKERDETANLDLREGRAALEAGNNDEALAHFERVVALRPDAPDGQYYLNLVRNGVTAIETAIRSANFSEAERLAHSYTETHPQSSWAWYALGYAFYGQRKLSESIRALAQSLQLDLKNAEAHKVLGRDLMIVGRFDAARLEFEQGMRYDPKSAEMPYNLGKLYSIQDNWALAKQNFEHALTLDPQYMEAFDGLGLALESLGDKDGAIANYQKAIDLNESRHGKFGAPYVNMSALYNAAGDSKTALAFAERGLAANASNDRALFQMAKAQAQQGENDRAVKSLHQAIAINPRASAYFYLLATEYRRIGKVEESRTAMGEFTKLNQLNNDLEQKRLDAFTEPRP
jgi:tetratricopeptide (TPR) repeat protein